MTDHFVHNGKIDWNGRQN